ncbi:Peptidase family M23 [Salinibacterium xinjiangense]|uniref:Peptidase family M23 n=2 Tax=Salinibacterium xinjiangense TaxID=386302 RepID=A0A2C8ZXY0_9MICO|nr:Peptidase family M23 [Salinibacterium xinjiangense]
MCLPKVFCSVYRANTGTRSHSGCAECFEKDSTAPPPCALQRSPHGCDDERSGTFHRDNDGRMLRSIVAIALMLLVPASAAPAAPRPSWDWPVDPPRVLVRQFIAPMTAYSSGHRGVDLATASGSVYAPADGVVHFAGVVVDRPVLSIRHTGGLISSYEPVETTLHKGATVARGDVIGTVPTDPALPGHCSHACLHFGVRRDGEYVSPLLYLGGIEPSVLLPTRR